MQKKELALKQGRKTCERAMTRQCISAQKEVVMVNEVADEASNKVESSDTIDNGNVMDKSAIPSGPVRTALGSFMSTWSQSTDERHVHEQKMLASLVDSLHEVVNSNRELIDLTCRQTLLLEMHFGTVEKENQPSSP